MNRRTILISLIVVAIILTVTPITAYVNASESFSLTDADIDNEIWYDLDTARSSWKLTIDYTNYDFGGSSGHSIYLINGTTTDTLENQRSLMVTLVDFDDINVYYNATCSATHIELNDDTVTGWSCVIFTYASDMLNVYYNNTSSDTRLINDYAINHFRLAQFHTIDGAVSEEDGYITIIVDSQIDMGSMIDAFMVMLPIAMVLGVLGKVFKRF